MSTVQFRIGLVLGALLMLWSVMIGVALAQSPVTPGYQICSTASGVTKCSFQPVGNGGASLTTYNGLPIAALAVATCGAQSLTAGVPYVMTMDLTGTLCTAGGGGGGGGLSVTDGATFTASISSFTPTGGEYSSAPTTCADGKQCTAALTVNREIRTHDTDVLAAVQAAIPAGTNIVGRVGIDQTTPGTTNAVSTTNWPTTVDTNSGNKSASTPRVVIATDQPNLATPLNVALAANQSVNLAQVAGNTQATGTGAQTSGTPRVTVATDQATNAGAALVKGGVGTVNGGSDYETVAASQTAQALGATGATGDYLSHCVLQPTTTGAGTATILDNATVIFTFTTGTLSNLAPIAIPIGAISVSGAWKVTTGANETMTCFGKFT